MSIYVCFALSLLLSLALSFPLALSRSLSVSTSLPLSVSLSPSAPSLSVRKVKLMLDSQTDRQSQTDRRVVCSILV